MATDIKPVASKLTKSKGYVGAFTPNNELQNSRVLFKGKINGPETIIFNDEGRMFAGVGTGSILELDEKTETFKEWCFTGGRPLSGCFDSNGDLIVTCALQGLLKVNHVTKEVTILSNRSDDGQPIHFADDVDIDKVSGKIYFTDATIIAPWRIGKNREFVDIANASKLEFLEGRKTGRLLEYDPSTRKTTVLVKGIWFANGVGFSVDRSFVLVTSTFERRIYRHWLQGEKKGTTDIFIDELPGFVDGVAIDESGRAWAAIIFPELNGFLRTIYPFKWVRSLFSKLPSVKKLYGLVVEISPDGKAVRSFHDPTGRVIHSISAVTYRDSKLYLGNLSDSVVVYDIKEDKKEDGSKKKQGVKEGEHVKEEPQ